MDSIDQILNVHRCVDIQGISLCLSTAEWHLTLGNATQVAWMLHKEFGDDYNMEMLFEDIEDLIPHATCYVSQYNDLCIVNLENAPEDFEF